MAALARGRWNPAQVGDSDDLQDSRGKTMRYIQTTDIPSIFQRRKSVQQFLGRSPADPDCIRYVELRPVAGRVEVWVYDAEDVGDEVYSDLESFPDFEPDGPQEPVATFDEPGSAVAYASTSVAADPARWVNEGVAGSEYADFVRAGRPLRWPTAG